MNNSIETKFIPVQVPDESRPGEVRFLNQNEINEINEWYKKENNRINSSKL